MKRLIRISVAAGCAVAGLLRRAERRAGRELTVLCYHRVLPAPQKSRYFIPDLVVTPEAFRVHCAILRERFDVRPLSAAVATWHSGVMPTRPLAAITFDDGYRDGITYAAPILHEAGLRATFFIITGLVGTYELPWYDRLAAAALACWARGPRVDVAAVFRRELQVDESVVSFNDPSGVARQVVAHAKRLAPEQRRRLIDRMVEHAGDDEEARMTPADADQIMTWPQLAELAAAGHEIGSHSRTHALLPQLDDATLHEEVAGSKQDLETHLHEPAYALCYPNGDVDDRVARAVTAAGYTCAVSTERGNNSPDHDVMNLRRHFMHEDRLCGLGGRTSAHLLRAQLAGLTDALLARGTRARRRGILGSQA